MDIQKTKYGYKLFGQCVGQIMRDNGDGTYKVWIPGVYDELFKETPEDLPDAKQVFIPFGSENIHDSIVYPLELHTKVWVFFMRGDPNYPVIFGKYLPDHVVKPNFPLVVTGPDHPLAIHHDKSRITMNKTGDMTIEVMDSNNLSAVASIKLENNGNMTIFTDKDLTINSTGKFSVQADEISLSATNDINIKSEKTNARISSNFGNVIMETAVGIVKSIAKNNTNTLNTGIK